MAAAGIAGVEDGTSPALALITTTDIIHLTDIPAPTPVTATDIPPIAIDTEYIVTALTQEAITITTTDTHPIVIDSTMDRDITIVAHLHAIHQGTAHGQPPAQAKAEAPEDLVFPAGPTRANASTLHSLGNANPQKPKPFFQHPAGQLTKHQTGVLCFTL